MNPRVKRLIDIEKLKQEQELGIGLWFDNNLEYHAKNYLVNGAVQPLTENLVKSFGDQPNPQFTTPEMDPLLSKSFRGAVFGLTIDLLHQLRHM